MEGERALRDLYDPQTRTTFARDQSDSIRPLRRFHPVEVRYTLLRGRLYLDPENANHIAIRISGHEIARRLAINAAIRVGNAISDEGIKGKPKIGGIAHSEDFMLEPENVNLPIQTLIMPMIKVNGEKALEAPPRAIVEFTPGKLHLGLEVYYNPDTDPKNAEIARRAAYLVWKMTSSVPFFGNGDGYTAERHGGVEM